MSFFENRKKQCVFLILYMLVMMTVVGTTVFFQYRFYTKNYNVVIASFMQVVHEKYSNVDEIELVEIIDDLSEKSDNKNAEYLEKYGIFQNKDSAVLKNEKAMRIFVFVDICLVFFAISGLVVYIELLKLHVNRTADKAHEYMKNINQGNYKLDMLDNKEGKFENLKSEIYKTAIKMRENAENAQKDKILIKESMSDISHQLKTPLASLSINIENIEMNPQIDMAKRQRLLRSAKRDIANINIMVQSILKLSRLEAGVVNFEKKQVRLGEIVETSVENVEALSELREIEVEVMSDSDKNEMIEADKYWQIQAVTNIIKNAVEHADTKVAIGYYAFSMYSDLIITNDGKPMSEKDMNNIFRRFYIGDDSVADSIGIGLSLAKAIVEKEGGEIMAEIIDGNFSYSDKNISHGTCFTIRYYR